MTSGGNNGKYKTRKKGKGKKYNKNKRKENEIRKVKKKKENAFFLAQTGSKGEEVSEKEREREREKRGVEREKLLSKIYGNRIVGFRLSKWQSRSTHRELHVGTKILEFHQTPQGRKFFYMGYF